MNILRIFRRRNHDDFVTSYIVAYMDLRDEVKNFCENVEYHLKDIGSSDNFTFRRTILLREKNKQIARKLAEDNP